MLFWLSADFFQNQLFRKKYFRNSTRVSNSLDSDQARQFVGPDLDPNCLQKLSAEDTSRQRVNIFSLPDRFDAMVKVEQALSVFFLYPATLKSEGYYVIPSIQKIAFECPSVCL